MPRSDGIRERVQQRSTNIAGYRRELEWSLANARQRSIDIAQEPLAEPGSLVVVPPRSILQIGLSERPNDKLRAILVQRRPSNFLRRRS